MSLVDPIKQPQLFMRQVDAMVRDAAVRPNAPDPFAAIDQKLDASFAAMVDGMMQAPVAKPAAEPAPPPAKTPHHATFQSTSADRAEAIGEAARVGMLAAALSGATGVAPTGPAANPLALIAGLTGASRYGASGPMPFMPPGAVGPLVSYAVTPPTGIPSATPPVAAIAGASPVTSAPSSEPLGAALEPLISEMSNKHGVPDWLVRNVIRAESGGNPGATSPTGAQGLMQLMPGTAAGLGVKDAYDPRQNVEGGAKYLRQMLDLFGGDMTKAVAAYNAGPGAVQRFGGVPPYGETQTYVKRVLG